MKVNSLREWLSIYEDEDEVWALDEEKFIAVMTDPAEWLWVNETTFDG
jgi:hypothetical protein